MLMHRRGAGTGGPQAAATTLLLDLIATQPTAAWSTRKLRAAYAGNALTVRRSSDDATQAIGFSSNDLATSTMTAFVGANNGFISAWNDQGGAGVDATQATTAIQPTIIASGTTKTLNGYPAIAWEADVGINAGTVLTNASAISTIVTASAYTVLAVMQWFAFSGGAGRPDTSGCLIGDAGGFWFPLGSGSDGGGSFEGGHYNGGNRQIIIGGSTATTYVVVIKYDGSNVTGYLNGGSPTQTATASGIVDLTNTIGLGRPFPGQQAYRGYSLECLVFNSALSSADINTLGANMATRAGVTWSAVP